MKKVFLLFMLMLVGAGALSGMEKEKPSVSNEPDYMAMLPKELKPLIVSTLTQSSTLEEAVNAIRSLTQTSKEFNTIVNNPITMRTIIRLLVQKFNAPSEYIAQQLETPGSQQYIKLSLKLKQRLFMKEFGEAESLIKNGADINYQTVDIYPMLCGSKETILLLSVLNQAHSKQVDKAASEKQILNLERIAMQSPEAAKRVEGGIKAIQQGIESDQEELNNHLIPIIRDQIQTNKNIFKDDEQLNQFTAEIDNGNFKKAFVILDPNTIISNKPTDYWYAIGETDLCIIGANLSSVMYTITANQPALLEWLIKHNANLNLTMGTGDAALAMAINLGNKEIVELLVKNGANVNQQKTLTLNENIKKKIKEFGADAKFGSFGQRGAIINEYTGEYYIVMDNDILTSIMSDGLDLWKHTPLLTLLMSEQFTEEEQYDLCKLLLDNGANPNMQDPSGNTPLTFAFPLESKFITLLLDYGANPSIKDNDGLTVVERMKLPVENEEEEEEDPEQEAKIQLLENAIKKQQKK